MNPERTFLIWSEGVMVKVQNATGVPIWKYSISAWRTLFIVAAVSDTLNGARPSWTISINGLLFILSFWNRSQKECQHRADSSAAVVPNEDFHNVAWGLGRYLAWFSVALGTLGLAIKGFNAAASDFTLWLFVLLILFATYSHCYNYWPITGSTIFDQIRAGLRRRVVN